MVQRFSFVFRFSKLGKVLNMAQIHPGPVSTGQRARKRVPPPKVTILYALGYKEPHIKMMATYDNMPILIHINGAGHQKQRRDEFFAKKDRYLAKQHTLRCCGTQTDSK